MDYWSLGRDPVDTDRPVGVDVRYEPDFETLQAEIDKLSLPSKAGDAVDWQKVADLAGRILAEQSKDLLVIGYFGVAQIHLAGLEGFFMAVRIYGDLLENFWNNLFPAARRMRGRLAAVEWWIEKSEAALTIRKPEPADEARITSLREALTRLEEIVRQCFTEPPSLRSLFALLEAVPLAQATPSPDKEYVSAQKKEDAPQPVRQETVENIKPPKSQPVDPTPQGSQSQHTGEKDAETTIHNALEAIRRASNTLREKSPSDPSAYQFLRLAIWSAIDTPPPATEGRTLIPPPDPQMFAILQNLHQRGDWINLLAASENQLTQNIFWLTLNRYSAEALEYLGTPYSKARESVVREAASLLQRIPELLSLAFADGTPFADPETSEWLQSLGPGNSQAMTASLSFSDDDSGESTETSFVHTMQQAQDLLREKKLFDAVGLLQQELEKSRSVRTEVSWRLGLSQLLIAARKADLALPHFEQLLEEIEKYQLAEWDPELTLKIYTIIRAGLQNSSDRSAKAKASEILNRIARLSPLEALRLEKN